MLLHTFRKEKISIELIGKQRFWIGITCGFITAVMLALLINHTREVLRFFTGISNDLQVLPPVNLMFYNIFFSVLTSFLGLSITIWIWMSTPKRKHKKDVIYKQLSRNNALLIFWFVLLAFSRLAFVLSTTGFGRQGYENQSDVFEDFWLLFVLLPIVVFLQNWYSVRLVYKSVKWMLFSFISCMLLSVILYFTTTVDQTQVNDNYFNKFEPDYTYVDKEVAKAQRKYGIQFTSKAVNTIKKWHTSSSVYQMLSLKKAFAGTSSVSLDNIILERMVIRNCKEAPLQHFPHTPLDRWNYAMPNDIISQLYLAKSDTNKIHELFNVLSEEIKLVNTPVIDWGDDQAYEKYTYTEIRRSFFAKNQRFVGLIRNRLQIVRDSLLNTPQFFNLAQDLPVIIEDENHQFRNATLKQWYE